MHERIHYHFLEGHEKEPGREIRQVTDTAIYRLSDWLNKRLEAMKAKTDDESDDDDNADSRKKNLDTLEKLIKNIRTNVFEYLEARVNLRQAASEPDYRRDKAAIEAADRARRNAHIAFVDSIRIAIRNLSDAENRLPHEFHPLVGSSDNEALRDRVADAAIDYFWALLYEGKDTQGDDVL